MSDVHDLFAAVRDVDVAELEDPASLVRRGKRRRSARRVGRSGLVLGALVAVVALVGPTLRTPQIGPITTSGPVPPRSMPAAEALRHFQGTSSYEQTLLDDRVTRDELRSSAHAVVACTEHHGYGTGGSVAYDIVSRRYGIRTGPSLGRAHQVSPDDCIAWFHDDVARAWDEQLEPRTPRQEQDLQGLVVNCLERESGVAHDGPEDLDDIQLYLHTEETGERARLLLEAYDACTQEP